MNGYSSHTFKWVNEEGEAHWVKLHFKTDTGIRNLSASEADALKSTNPDSATEDLFKHIAQGSIVTLDSVNIMIL